MFKVLWLLTTKIKGGKIKCRQKKKWWVLWNSVNWKGERSLVMKICIGALSFYYHIQGAFTEYWKRCVYIQWLLLTMIFVKWRQKMSTSMTNTARIFYQTTIFINLKLKIINLAPHLKRQSKRVHMFKGNLSLESLKYNIKIWSYLFFFLQ